MSKPPIDHFSINLPEAFPWGVAVIDSKNGRVFSANAHMKELYCCEAGKNVDALFRGQGGASLYSVIEKLGPDLVSTERIYPQENSYGIASVDVILQRDKQDPSKVWLYTLEHPKVEKEVRFSSRSELKMLRVLLDNTLEYIYFRDPKGNFILTNKAFLAAVSDGFNAPGVDSTISDFVSEESAAWFGKMDRRLLDDGRAVVNEVNNVTLNSGIRHWLQLSVVPVRNDEGEMIGSLSVARDISELKRTEEDLRHAIVQAREASRAKGEFLAAMSHEIRTPINGIVGASELCEETRLDPEQRSYIDTVLQCGGTLLALVNDVLDFSKIEAGQLTLEKLNFVPRTLMENVADSFVQETRKKGIELITAFDAELPNYLMGDPTRLKQVLNNLVSNAVKFTEEGEIVIRAETLEVSEGYAKVKLSVRDTGVGISKQRQDAIFESFTQEDMSTTRKYGGTGLGLSISRELIELMGGKITVQSEAGRGSVFAVELVLERSSYQGAEAVPYNLELAGMRVLIVDDNETNREIYSQMCAGWGYRHSIAKGGSEAIPMLEKAKQEGDPFELVLLDQQMPGLSGLDVASLIKSRSELKATRLILLSSSLDRKESERAADIGIARALSKPVKRHTLLEVILETFKLGYAGENAPATQRSTELGRSLDVLLVEDNLVNQVVAKQRLKKLGHQVTLAEDGRYALDAVKEKHFDCILMDIQMPGKDGFETTSDIRKFEQENGQTPHYIVAMTAHAMKGDEERCLAGGMNNYLSKPFRAKFLKEVLFLAAEYDDRCGSAQRGKDQCVADYLDTMEEEDREDFFDVCKVFLGSLPDEVAKLHLALKDKDFKQCYGLAHTFKSTIAIFGKQGSVEKAQAMELASEKEAEEEVLRIGEELIKSLHELALEIELELEKRGD